MSVLWRRLACDFQGSLPMSSRRRRRLNPRKNFVVFADNTHALHKVSFLLSPAPFDNITMIDLSNESTGSPNQFRIFDMIKDNF